MSLETFLSKKPLFYDVIDYERFPKAVASITHPIRIPKIIHMVGTNGKGSTGRFLATALGRAGYRVGHYTSPHILRFNERIWLNGNDIGDQALEAAHEALLDILPTEIAESLSYFEYTTLLALVVFEACDYIVFEAGLGGEHDATNTFDKVLSVFTPIDFDHAAFLGNEIESIAATKLRSMQKLALLGKQNHPEVALIAKEIAQKKECVLYSVAECSTSNIRQTALHLAKKNGLSEYLRDNLELSMCAFELLGLEVDEAYFDQGALFGRLSKIAPNVTLDVGHNPLAARSIAQSLAGEKVTLIYNTYRDKDYGEILSILHPVIQSVEIIEVEEERIVERELLEKALDALAIEHKRFETISPEKEYLVFGSFSVAEAYMKRCGEECR